MLRDIQVNQCVQSNIKSGQHYIAMVPDIVHNTMIIMMIIILLQHYSPIQALATNINSLQPLLFIAVQCNPSCPFFWDLPAQYLTILFYGNKKADHFFCFLYMYPRVFLCHTLLIIRPVQVISHCIHWAFLNLTLMLQ